TEAGYSHPRNMLQRVTHGVPAGAYRDAIRHFVDCARSGNEPLIPLEDSRDVTAVLEAAHESIRTRQPVSVPARPAATARRPAKRPARRTRGTSTPGSLRSRPPIWPRP